MKTHSPGQPPPMSSSAALPDAIPLDVFDDYVKESFGCQIIGFTIATTSVVRCFSEPHAELKWYSSIYGITVMQTYLYFRRCTSDKISLKLFVREDLVRLQLSMFETIIRRSCFSSKTLPWAPFPPFQYLCSILDTLATVLIAHAMYTYFVLNFMNLAKDVDLVWYVYLFPFPFGV